MKMRELIQELHYWYDAGVESSYLDSHGSFVLEQLCLNCEITNYPYQETTNPKDLGNMSSSIVQIL